MGAPRSAASERRIKGWAGFGLVLLLVLAVTLSLLLFNRSFTQTRSLTVYSDRAGLVMDRDAKVRYRGVEIGRVASVESEGDRARINLEVDPASIGTLPADAVVEIRSNTVFGAKGVNFLPGPSGTSGPTMSAGDSVDASRVTTEVNTLFQDLSTVVGAVDPDKLNATLSAIGQALDRRGDDLGSAMEDLNTFLRDVNPKLPQLKNDLAKTAVVADLYAGVMPDIMTTLDHSTKLGEMLIDEQENFDGFLIALSGLGRAGGKFLGDHGDATVLALHNLRPTLDLAGTYSPGLTCFIVGLNQGRLGAQSAFGAENQPGLVFDSSIVAGAQSYRYPDHLPKVEASGGPRCNGLPYLDGNAPYVVTDTGYNPFPPGSDAYRLPQPATGGRTPSLLEMLVGPAPDGRSW